MVLFDRLLVLNRLVCTSGGAVLYLFRTFQQLYGLTKRICVGLCLAKLLLFSILSSTFSSIDIILDIYLSSVSFPLLLRGYRH